MPGRILKFLFPQTSQVVEENRGILDFERRLVAANTEFDQGVTRAQARMELLKADPKREHAILFIFGEPLRQLAEELRGVLSVAVHFTATPEEGLLAVDTDPDIKLVVIDACVNENYSLSGILSEFRTRIGKRPLGTIIVVTDARTRQDLRSLRFVDSAVTHPINLPDLVKLLQKMYNKAAPETGEHPVQRVFEVL